MSLIYLLLWCMALKTNAMAQRIARGFNDPVYALTAGHSDSLLVLCSVELMETDWEPLESVYFCAVPQDMTGAYQADKSVLDLPLTESIRAPQVFNLPVRFNFEGERRTIAEREFFTYIGHPIQAKEPIEGFRLRAQNPRPRLRPNYSGAAMIFLAKCNPNETYEEHVWSVYLAWKQLIDKHSGAINRLCDRHSIDRDRFLISSLLCVAFHDMGKLSANFQRIMYASSKADLQRAIRANFRHEYASTAFVFLGARNLQQTHGQLTRSHLHRSNGSDGSSRPSQNG